MRGDWLGGALVPIGIAVATALFRRFAPTPRPSYETWTLADAQPMERLAPGVTGLIIFGFAICCFSSFFLFRGTNRLWAETDGPALLRLYPSQAIWCFFPAFAAISIPWPLVVWLLKRLGRTDEAHNMTDRSSQDAGMDSFKVLKWFSFWLCGPIFILTLLAIPIHLSITDTEARVGHYATWNSEAFPFKDARRATIIDNRSPNIKGDPLQDLVIDFADHRRLSANAAGDGGTKVDNSTIYLLLQKTGLTPQHAATKSSLSTP